MMRAGRPPNIVCLDDGTRRASARHLQRPLGHQVALDLVTLRGDAVPGCREPAGFAVILIDDASVVVHHQQLFNGETEFWL